MTNTPDLTGSCHQHLFLFLTLKNVTYTRRQLKQTLQLLSNRFFLQTGRIENLLQSSGQYQVCLITAQATKVPGWTIVEPGLSQIPDETTSRIFWSSVLRRRDCRLIQRIFGKPFFRLLSHNRHNQLNVLLCLLWFPSSSVNLNYSINYHVTI